MSKCGGSKIVNKYNIKNKNNKSIIFKDALNHCRWKKRLKTVLKDINISEYKNKTFKQIFCKIHKICSNYKQIGILTVYDLTSGLCNYYNINIKRVYIIGGGPQRAIKLLKLEDKVKKHNINKKIKLKYVNINDIIKAFNKNSYKLDKNIKNSKDGDEFESYICNWQKDF